MASGGVLILLLSISNGISGSMLKLFSVFDSVEFKLCEFCIFGYDIKSLSVVGFSATNLEVPMTEPLGLLVERGERRYLWRDFSWLEFDLPATKVLMHLRLVMGQGKKEPRLEQICNLVSNYRYSRAPSEADQILTPARKFYRALYRVRD